MVYRIGIAGTLVIGYLISTFRVQLDQSGWTMCCVTEMKHHWLTAITTDGASTTAHIMRTSSCLASCVSYDSVFFSQLLNFSFSLVAAASNFDYSFSVVS